MTQGYSTKSFVYPTDSVPAVIDAAYQTELDTIVNTLGGTVLHTTTLRIGNEIRVTILYKSSI